MTSIFYADDPGLGPNAEDQAEIVEGGRAVWTPARPLQKIRKM